MLSLTISPRHSGDENLETVVGCSAEVQIVYQIRWPNMHKDLVKQPFPHPLSLSLPFAVGSQENAWVCMDLDSQLGACLKGKLRRFDVEHPPEYLDFARSFFRTIRTYRLAQSPGPTSSRL